MLRRIAPLLLLIAAVLLAWPALEALMRGLAPADGTPRTVSARGDLAADEQATIALFENARHSVVVQPETGVRIDTRFQISGESFLTPPGELSDLIANAVQAETGRRPEASTSGGTSDARFVRYHCPVVEFGLVGKTMHQVDERVEVAQIHQLKAIYGRILRDYYA